MTIEVRLGDGDSVERALKLFRRKLQKAGLFKEFRRRRHDVKPSEARLVKAARHGVVAWTTPETDRVPRDRRRP